MRWALSCTSCWNQMDRCLFCAERRRFRAWSAVYTARATNQEWRAVSRSVGKPRAEVLPVRTALLLRKFWCSGPMGQWMKGRVQKTMAVLGWVTEYSRKMDNSGRELPERGRIHGAESATELPDGLRIDSQQETRGRPLGVSERKRCDGKQHSHCILALQRAVFTLAQ